MIVFIIYRLLFRVISVDQGKALAEKWGATYVDASAKENQVGRYIM